MSPKGFECRHLRRQILALYDDGWTVEEILDMVQPLTRDYVVGVVSEQIRRSA